MIDRLVKILKVGVSLTLICTSLLTLASCSAYKDIVIGGLEPAKAEDVDAFKDYVVALLDKEMEIDVNRSTINVARGEKKEEWYAYAFTDADRALGILVEFNSKTKKASIGLNEKTYEARTKLISHMNEIRPDNSLFNCYVDFFPVGFNTKRYQTDVTHPRLSYWVVVEGYDEILPDKREAYFEKLFAEDYKIIVKATELYKELFWEEETNRTLSWVSVKYIDKKDFDMSIFDKKGGELSDNYITMDRSAVPSYIVGSTYVYNRGEAEAKLICEYEFNIRGDQLVHMEYAPYMKEVDLFVTEVFKHAKIK